MGKDQPNSLVNIVVRMVLVNILHYCIGIKATPMTYLKPIPSSQDLLIHSNILGFSIKAAVRVTADEGVHEARSMLESKSKQTPVS